MPTGHSGRPQNEETPRSRAVSAGHPARGRFCQQKMYSRVAFGLPLLTSREYQATIPPSAETRKGNERSVEGHGPRTERFWRDLAVDVGDGDGDSDARVTAYRD